MVNMEDLDLSEEEKAAYNAAFSAAASLVARLAGA